MAEDSDVAFNLQVEEVLAASGAGASLSNADPALDDVLLGATNSDLFLFDSLSMYDQQFLDFYEAETEAERLRMDLCRQIHDRAVACEVANVPDEEWRETGDNLHRPYGEGSSSSYGQGISFIVYVKGLTEGVAGAIGVAICDANDGLVFQVSKGVTVNDGEENAEMVEMKALIEGFDVSQMLDLKRIVIVTDNSWLYQFITGQNPKMIPNVATLADQIQLLLRKFTDTRVSLVARDNIKFAFDLARSALAAQVNRSIENSGEHNKTHNCAICLEDTYMDQMFTVTDCLHSYCHQCMSKHVQVKLLQGMLPKCPYLNCKSELKLDACGKFLSAELIDIMSERLKEASIPAGDKIYCPYPRCSALLSKTELGRLMGDSNGVSHPQGCRKCPKCIGIFCISCKAPWHSNMACSEFKLRNPHPSNEDQKLKSLATQNLWRQCPKCNHMVSLATGCYHIYCRCGHEFCYTCGADWIEKKPTCSCPIWDEHNIEYEQN